MSPKSRSETLQAALRAQGIDARPVDVETLREMKEMERERDDSLIAAGLATAHEIQAKNSFVPEGAVIEVIDRSGSFAIENLPDGQPLEIPPRGRTTR